MTGSTAGFAEPDHAALLELLEETPAFTLATLDPDGAPRATPLFFAADDLALVFLSDPASQHSRNLQADPRCAASLYPAIADWRELRGLQLRGRARRLRETEAPRALQLYLRRFPFAADLAQAVEATAPYRFQPNWIRRIDNRQGFGFQQEWDLDG
ncbi:MAG: pyridoxamine 5'-phosphate oxidase family protein [Anaerolineales bacterium]|nr:pyridoxamine 5'-phosphate oxidase family protein [Anaerolineales bacterium]